MKKYQYVIWELVLIGASVLIFRSLWMIMDKYLVYFNEYWMLLASLVFGLLLAFISLYVLAQDK
jgi:hypothetical protein